MGNLQMSSLKETLARVMKKLSDPKEIEASKLMAEKHKKEERAEFLRENYTRSGLPWSNVKTTLATIEPKNEKQKKLINVLRKIVKSIDIMPYIYGPPGTGKSFIARAFASSLIRSGVGNVKWVPLSSFMIDYRRSGFNSGDLTLSLINSSVLMLDDFCSHNITKHAIEAIHSILSARLEKEAPTLITSNVALNKVAPSLYEMGEANRVPSFICDAIEDRLFELCSIFKLDGQSIRTQKALKRFKSGGTK